MDKRKRNRIIYNVVFTVIMLVAFVAYAEKVNRGYKQRFTLISDGPQYCYGIDWLEKKDNTITLKGWFIELKSLRNVQQNVSDCDSEMMFALIPIDEAKIGSRIENASIMQVVKMHEERLDVNEYFSCEFDYSKCGFVTSIDCDNVDLSGRSYRLAIKLDAETTSKAVLTNVYITKEGVLYTNPSESPQLDTVGTDIDEIVSSGVRLVNRPDVGCYIYQLKNKLYWITDEKYDFNGDNKTYLNCQLDTTQLDNISQERIDKKIFFEEIDECFEKNEISNSINCGKYRASVITIPREYSINHVTVRDGEWRWRAEFKLNYVMLE